MRHPLYLGFICFVAFCFIGGLSPQKQQENTAPEVKVRTLLAHGIFQWNALVPYIITVSDLEDGHSKYDEINLNEVMLVVKYLKDSTQIKHYLNNESNTDYKPLVWMGTSTCFNCHKAKGTLIGPSFDRIAHKYQDDPKAMEVLAQKIITGGTSNWGDEIMPPHPDLNKEQAKEMAHWILENNLDLDKNYLAGIEGVFKTKEKPPLHSKKGIYVLTASYTDRGINDLPQSRKQTQQTIILKSN